MQILKLLKTGEVFPVNEKLAGVVPMSIPVEQQALADSIAEYGLEVPVTLYKGEIVDGRCRQRACTATGVPVRAVDLDDNLSESDVKLWVKLNNRRRSLTVTQKAIVAMKESLEKGNKSQADIAKSWAISSRILNMARYIHKVKPEFTEPLFNGETVDITNDKSKTVSTSKVTAIYGYIRREEESVTEKKSHTWSAVDAIETQLGKEWFFKTVKEAKITDVAVMVLVAELANLKFTTDSQ